MKSLSTELFTKVTEGIRKDEFKKRAVAALSMLITVVTIIIGVWKSISKIIKQVKNKPKPKQAVLDGFDKGMEQAAEFINRDDFSVDDCSRLIKIHRDRQGYILKVKASKIAKIVLSLEKKREEKYISGFLILKVEGETHEEWGSAVTFSLGYNHAYFVFNNFNELVACDIVDTSSTDIEQALIEITESLEIEDVIPCSAIERTNYFAISKEIVGPKNDLFKDLVDGKVEVVS